jgi:hypothetical protein
MCLTAGLALIPLIERRPNWNAREAGLSPTSRAFLFR